MPSVRAVSFDLWDTVFVDESDEPRRAAAGLPPKPIARRELVARALTETGQPLERRLVDCAYDTADAAFRHVWYQQHVTWTVAERLGVVLAGLGRSLPAAVLAGLVEQHERMELDISPDLATGAAKAIRALAERYRLVVVSDAIFSPGWALRRILARHDLERCFCGFVFSDEAGQAKPAPELFHRAAELAGCRVEELVHLGDREEKDVAGPHAVGARAVLLTAVRDRGSQQTRAEAVCSDYSRLADVLAGLEIG